MTNQNNQNGIDELNWKLTKLLETSEAQTRKVDEIYTALFVSTTTKDSILETLKKHDVELKANKDAYVNHVKVNHNTVKTILNQTLTVTVNTIVAGTLIWLASIFLLGLDKKFEVKINQINPPAQIRVIEQDTTQYNYKSRYPYPR